MHAVCFVFGALTANAPRSPKPDEQLRLSFIRRADQLALNVAEQPAQYRSLAFEHAVQALELFCVRKAARTTTQLPAFACISMFDCEPGCCASCISLARATSSRRLSLG